MSSDIEMIKIFNKKIIRKYRWENQNKYYTKNKKYIERIIEKQMGDKEKDI